MDAPVVQNERRLGVVVVDENVEDVDRFGSEADRVVDDFLAAVSPENIIAEEMIVPGEDEQERVSVSEEREEFIVRTGEEAESTASESPENKAFVTASNLLVESRKAEELADEAKMELYGLHKIATEGSCREAQPMAIMVTARAKWNAWQKLGNMSQEEAMEQYLALVLKEIPGLVNNTNLKTLEDAIIL
ncbi:hypothetical protein Bca52824_014755 [Brassica carinata]|uniref:ACB domain-containing protein n=1 Tax=Brassica carinata TaxID=52824 RepID=A0A8X7W228_BRACI|nr:hypothetical protein Bca52824_014755 [Brassica carinata]